MELLTDNLPLLASAPNGIKKLRELVFELAAQGKLIPGSPDAKYVLLGDIAEFVMGQAPPGTECNKNGQGFVFVKTGEFGELYPEVREWTTKPLKFAKDGDVLICVVGATVGKLNLGISCAIGRSVAAIRPTSQISTRYLYFSLIPFTLRLREQSRGSAQGVIGKTELSAVRIRLPSETEQHRIVAKIDELMALCDTLGAQQADAESAHARLVQALLDSLTQASRAEDFAASWQRLSQHFDTVFITVGSIDALKKTLLQLAVMGRLVPQNLADEPTDTLMHRLRKKRSRWLFERQDADSECRAMQRKLAALPEVKLPFSLPHSWEGVHLIDCARLLVDCHNKTAPYAPAGIPIIRTSNIRDREFRWDDLKYVTEATYEFWSRRCPPQPGDIMFTREAPMGEAAIVPENAKYCLGQSPPRQNSCRPDRSSQLGGNEGRTQWLDTDKHSRTERWRGCCRRKVRHWTRWRESWVLAPGRWSAGVAMRCRDRGVIGRGRRPVGLRRC